MILFVILCAVLAAADDDWACPKHCHCLPDPQLPDKFKLSCTRPTLRGPPSLADVPVTRVSSFSQTCPASAAKPSILEADTFAGFIHLRHLAITDCQLNQSSLPLGLLKPFKHLVSLRLERLESTVTGGDLSVDSGFFSSLEKTDHVSLAGSRIPRLPGGAFCHLSELKMLNLSGAGLDSLAATGFPGAKDCKTNILVLDLSHNAISAAGPRDFAAFPLLRLANLHNNTIQRIPADALPAELRTLRVDGNRIHSVDGLPASLSELDLSRNRLSIIPQAVAEAASLRTLNLSSNAVDHNSPFALANPDLTALDLSNNAFTALPRGFFANLTSLTKLHLAANPIAALADDQFEGLASLRLLDLSSNTLTKLSAAAFQGLPSLESLLLSNNSIASMDGELFSFLPQLTSLDLASNLLLDVPPQLTKLYHLRSLDLSENRISTVTKFLFDKLTNLVRLGFAANRLAALERYTFEDMASLEELDLSHNQIQTLEPHSFDRNPKLRTLRLDSNRIAAVDDVFQSLPALLELNLTANEITFLDYGMLPGSLRRLLLTHNRLSTLTNLRSPRLDLAHLDLSFNNLTFLNNYSLPNSLATFNVSYNRLSAIEAGTMRGKMKLVWVDLRWNGLREVSRESLRIEEGDLESEAVVFLSGNPLECSCELEWMKKAMERAQRVRMPTVADYAALSCTQPHSGKTSRLSDLDQSQLLCPYRQICSADCLCCDFDACDCKNLCPAGCDCFHDSSYLENIVHCTGSRNPPVSPRSIPMYATQIYLDGGRMPKIPRHAFLGRFKLRHLYLNGSGIRHIEPRAFHGLTSLEVLDLSDNHLEEIRGDEFSKLDKLRHLFLNGNALRSLRDGALDDLPSLQALTLHDNRIQILPQTVIDRPLAGLTLRGNPFLCDCGEPFAIQSWLPKHTGLVRDAGDVFCGQELHPSPDPNLNHTTLHQTTIVSRYPPKDGMSKVNFWLLRKEMNRSLCNGAVVSLDATSPEFELFGMSLSAIIAVAALLVFVVFGACIFLVFAAIHARRKDGTVPGGTIKNRKGPASVNSSGTATTPVPLINHDAFVSYSLGDSEWVLRELAGRLEGEPPFHSLCLLHRDLPTPLSTFSQYHLVNDDIALAMRRSSALLLVLSPAFLAQEWETTQVKVAHLVHLKEKTSKLIFIILGDVRLDSVDPALGPFLRSNTLLLASHPLFWDQLRDALPCRTTDSLPSSSDPEYSHLYYGPIVPSRIL